MGICWKQTGNEIVDYQQLCAILKLRGSKQLIERVRKLAETLGSRLRQARAMRDATIYDVQKQTGISASTLSLYERDLRTPSLDRLETLANFLGASIDWLTGKRNEDWTPERLGILEELKNDPSANTMMKMVVQGRKLGELPEEDMLKIVKFIEFIRHDNRSKK